MNGLNIAITFAATIISLKLGVALIASSGARIEGLN
jgi:hypothetical protein